MSQICPSTPQKRPNEPIGHHAYFPRPSHPEVLLCGAPCSHSSVLVCSLYATPKARRTVARGSPAATLASRPTRSVTSGRLPLRRPLPPRQPGTTRQPLPRTTVRRGSRHRGGTPIIGVDAARRTACRLRTSSTSARKRKRSGLAITGQHHGGVEKVCRCRTSTLRI